MRLRKLTLSGFKSFADKTEFLFDEGITGVVGPNGCGKSNVVDAVKWVLGEQSAKSLRGSEMMDVIFNGSSSRKPSSLCEVALEFENEGGAILQALGADGNPSHIVSITRRLYRSGESEYLINGQVARLRDIREMFMDTGVGAHAYSIIEQGRVAELLQSNPVDRRLIFEEAAGISKYKSRKKEAIRKLERVEQNLLRLNDILAEVQKRLRSIKQQAGKARNYQQYAEQLKELRAMSSLAQYHTLRGERTSLQARLDQLNDQLTGMHTRIEQLEFNRGATEAEMTELEQQARQVDGEIATLVAQASSCEQRIEMLGSRCRELDEQMQAAIARDRDLEERIAQAEESVQQNDAQLKTVELQLLQHAEQIEAMMEEQQEGQLSLTHLQGELEEEKAGTIDLLRRTSALHNEITTSGVRRESLSGQQQRLTARADQMAGQMEQLLASRCVETGALEEIQTVLAQVTEQLETAKAESLTAAQNERALDVEISQAKERRSSLASRHNTLEEMQRKGEGVADGVRRILASRKQGKLGFIRGMLAEFIRADLANAAIVEAALAGMDQYVVVDHLCDLVAGRREIDAALNNAGVEVLCLDHLGPMQDRLNLSKLPVPTVRAMDMVSVEDPTAAPAVWRLLGSTLVVDSLESARLAAQAAPHGYRFVTRDGAVLEADGRVRFGTARIASGVISRRSELTQLSRELETLKVRIDELTSQRKVAADQRAQLDDVQQKLRAAIYEANTERVDHQGRLNRVTEQLTQLQREQPIVARDIETIAGEIEQTVIREHEAREKVVELERLSVDRQKRIEELTTQMGAARSRQDHLVAQLTERRVQHAQASEQRTQMHETTTRLRRSMEQMQRERADAAGQAEANRQRKVSAEEGIASARASIEEIMVRKAELDQQAADVHQSRRGLAERIEQIRTELNAQRRQQEQQAQGANQCRVEVSEADVRIENLITRVTDEMGMDLVAQFANYQHDDQRDWNAVNAEILDLRGKIERLGNVNLDAIAEQEELETRDKFLGDQLKDIDESKKQLSELIEKINAQSKDMFVTTFEAIRANYQTVFRKLFGGGKADILLADPNDVLECGIDIIARPPGKELRSITLLSGGEKTMATVALLFSIFRAKPSPFCILDEVDAALDEANNERFNTMVTEFLDQSQFIVITHSKRTMSIANVLYGVTMQEAGVSRRVSVKFEEAAQLVAEDVEAGASAQ